MKESQQGYSRVDEVFAERLKEVRKVMGVSQETLADKMVELGYNIHVTAIGKIERGERKVSVGEAAAMAELFGLALDDLLGGGMGLKTALATFQRDRSTFGEQMRLYVESMLEVVVSADSATEMTEKEREWLVEELPRQTPARMTADALVAFDAAMSRSFYQPDTEFVQRLRRQLERDAELLNSERPPNE